MTSMRTTTAVTTVVAPPPAVECGVCVEKFNRTTHKRVSCLYCGYEACHKCVEAFLIGNTVVPKCMGCKTEWNMEFLRTSLPKSFMDKEYREHQKDAILAEAEATVGDLQHLARFQVEKEAMMERVEQLRQEFIRARNNYESVRHQLYHMRYREEEAAVQEKAAGGISFHMACPRNECRGLLSSAYKCGMCSMYFCAQCHGNKGEDRNAEHTCNADDVETVKLLRDNTHQCPKCHIGISKVSGCDQMWCVNCHTCFSWRTGNILNGVVHNPHFYEFQRRNGGGQAPRVPGDVPCGGIPYLQEMRAVSRQHNVVHSQLFSAHRLCNHLTQVTMPRVYTLFHHRNQKNRLVGIKFLRGLVTKEGWRDMLYKISRQDEKYRRWYQVLETLTINIAELLRQFVSQPATDVQVVEGIKQLLLYANEESARMRKQFDMTLPVLSLEMDTTRL